LPAAWRNAAKCARFLSQPRLRAAALQKKFGKLRLRREIGLKITLRPFGTGKRVLLLIAARIFSGLIRASGFFQNLSHFHSKNDQLVSLAIAPIVSFAAAGRL
jgi:hypothetical protein